MNGQTVTDKLVEIHNAQTTVDVLNDLLGLDKAAISALVSKRVQVNNEVANHPHAQVAQVGDIYMLGLLGVLNALHGKSGKRITAVYSDGDSAEPNIVRFELWDEKYFNMAENVEKENGEEEVE